MVAASNKPTVFVITGVGRGIGHDLAQIALSRGHTVYGSVRRMADAQALGGETVGTFVPLVFDVTDHQSIGGAAAEIAGHVDILINNAGVIGPPVEQQSPLNMDFDGFAATLSINTMAPLAVAQAFLPALRRAAHPRILTISSQMSWMGYRKADQIAYRASKAAVNKVMQGLATALEPENIPVALIEPGWVRTDMGGSEADLAVADVARGILDVADSLMMSQTGRFIKWSGEERSF
jgi:NAD(P)-dependent dehydrogenase (short-subunit alcohol dehydrogenase family)